MKPNSDAAADGAWNASTTASPAAKPSWLAPPFESQTLPIGTRSEAPAPDAEPESPPIPPPSLRLVSSLSAPRLPQLDVGTTAGARPSSPPAYPDLRESVSKLQTENADLRAALEEVRSAVISASEPQLVRLACAIAERVVGRELTVDPSAVLSWIREATQTLVTTEPMTLVVSADLGAVLDRAAILGVAPAGTLYEVDASFGPMHCEVRARASRVVASLEERLASVAHELDVSQE